MEKGSVYPL